MRTGASVLEPVPDMLLAKLTRRALVAAILALPAAAAPAQSHLTAADNLAATGRAAAARRVPVMIVFTETTCSYCATAKTGFLVPLQAHGPFSDKVILREVDVQSDRRMRDFDGRATTHREYARRRSVRRVPTVMVLDARGQPLSEPIVGLMGPDFYRLYLEQAIEEGLFKLRAKR